MPAVDIAILNFTRYEFLQANRRDITIDGATVSDNLGPVGPDSTSTTTATSFQSPLTNIIDCPLGGQFVLLTFNVVTGLVSSTILPTQVTRYLTERAQQILANVSGLSNSTYFPRMIRDMLAIDMLDTSFDFGFSLVVLSGNTWTLTITNVPVPSKFTCSVAWSGNSALAAADRGVDTTP